MLHYTKMQGLGNDYLYHFGALAHPEAYALRDSDRHFGIGSDGIILIAPSQIADFQMRIFNADGSEAKMCGNGIRCVGKYVYDKGYTQKTHLSIETLSGIRTLELRVQDGKVASAVVDMGQVVVDTRVTLRVDGADGGDIVCTPVNVGNPHCVLFVEDAEHAPLTTLGAALEHHAFFPEGVNVEFVQVRDRHALRMRVWERGSGITWACGTGACASAAAAVQAGYCDADAWITVALDGGDLRIKVLPDGRVMMDGPAETICECEVEAL